MADNRMIIFSFLQLPEVSEVFKDCWILLMEAWKIDSNEKNLMWPLSAETCSFLSKNIASN